MSSSLGRQCKRLSILVFVASLSCFSFTRMTITDLTGVDMDTLYSSVMEHYSAILSNNNRKPRVFLGISSREAHRKMEGKRRRVVRQTYLQFHHQHHASKNMSKIDHRICSLPELLSKVDSPNECQMVYTFLFPNSKRMTEVSTAGDLLMNNSTSMADGETTMSKRILARESDAIFFKLNSKNDEFEAIMKWIQWSTKIQDTIGSNVLGQFDYLAYIDVGTMVYPHEFWGQNTIFQHYQPSVFAAMSKRTSGDVDNEEKDCKESFCFDHRFTCVSQDLANYLASEERAAVIEGGVGPNLVQHVKDYQESSGNEVSWFTVEGVRMVYGEPENLLNKWESYVASITDFASEEDMSTDEVYPHANVTTYHGSPRILVGIFTTNLKHVERKRRHMIRNAYLGAYKKSKKSPHRICSLQDLQKQKVQPEDCQFAYTFVVGANSSAPTEQVDTDDMDTIAIPRDKLEKPEPDVLYLNIQENMNEGKTDTWFRYASLIVEREFYFDYMAKMDTDTVIFPHPLFEKMQKWPTYPNNRRIYGGEYNVKRDGENRNDLLVGASYFNGPFYWISPDVARFITDSTKCNRTALRTSAEDMTIGNYVNSFPHTIHRFQMSRKTYAHPYKDIGHFQKRWGRYKRKFNKYHKF